MAHAARKKKVYIVFGEDHLHEGQIKIVNHARLLGEVILGILSNKAIASHKRVPTTTLEQRMLVANSLSGISEVVVQDTASWTSNLRKYKPDYVLHGEDWENEFADKIRREVTDTLKDWGGELVKVPGTKARALSHGVATSQRLGALRRLIDLKDTVRVMEAHNGLTGLLAENTSVKLDSGVREFDAIWASSFTDSTAKGKPDTQAVDFTSRLNTIDQILDVTTKAIIVDGDNGGLSEHFYFFVRTLERLGVSAVVIEDKIGAKRNSLFGNEKQQNQDSVEEFCKKIRVGKKAQVTAEFMIIARVESLILGLGQEDALARAVSYVEAGADGIMIHSNAKEPGEILAFADKYRKMGMVAPLICAPTAYNQITEEELQRAGLKIVIYANHLIRSAYPAMLKTAELILKHGRSYEADEFCLPIKQILNLIPENG